MITNVAMDWVLAQTIDRKRRQLEAEEMEYAERFARARQKELIMRKAAKARVRKKLVRLLSTSSIAHSQARPQCRKLAQQSGRPQTWTWTMIIFYQKAQMGPCKTRTTICRLLFAL